MARVVIVGGGLAGLPAAYELRAMLPVETAVTVVNATDHFQFVPSNPWVAVGWRRPDQITVPLGPPLARRGIDLVASPAATIDAAGRRVVTADGSRLPYDVLVITTGPELAFDEVPGAGPDAHSHSICTLDHAHRTWEAYRTFLEAPGPAVIGALPGASCFGPVYEYAMILDRDLRRRRLRHRVPMTLVTPEPYIGHLGLGGVEDSKGLLESELRRREIRWICNARVTAVDAGAVQVEELDEDGGVRRRHALPSEHSMLLPAFRGVAPVRAVDGLCNPRGLVTVDACQRSPRYPEIFAAGVCIAIPPLEQTPVATGAPKTGYMIETMVSAIARNVRDQLQGVTPTATGTWNAICLADLGNTGVAFVALPQNPPRNVTWARRGRWVHFAKMGFERYFLRKMRAGISEPAYEKYLLKALGISRLSE